MQIAHRLRLRDERLGSHIAGAFTDGRTGRYLCQMQSALGLAGVVLFEWPDGGYADL